MIDYRSYATPSQSGASIIKQRNIFPDNSIDAKATVWSVCKFDKHHMITDNYIHRLILEKYFFNENFGKHLQIPSFPLEII